MSADGSSSLIVLRGITKVFLTDTGFIFQSFNLIGDLDVEPETAAV